jgi:hypothetical protein
LKPTASLSHFLWRFGRFHPLGIVEIGTGAPARAPRSAGALRRGVMDEIFWTKGNRNWMRRYCNCGTKGRKMEEGQSVNPQFGQDCPRVNFTIWMILIGNFIWPQVSPRAMLTKSWIYQVLKIGNLPFTIGSWQWQFVTTP